ncbi:endonuclease NucS domain-containing protein [Pseudovibrio exalbescens]|uniref:endonuclease NucS domain-containing protein n=1 Tax=Pseudovibrio exalbescens TaxID=197461 RepID=UPI0015E09ED6|nr:endonuclease NucS domain-containing protein [Pseudovibrio exalbescens]
MNNPALQSAIGQLKSHLNHLKEKGELKRIQQEKGQVLKRFGPLLDPANLSNLKMEDIRPFFYYEHNRHWNGLYRQVNRVLEHPSTFSTTLAMLLDEALPIEQRMTEAIQTIKGMGTAIATAFLTVAYPATYGVWNATSQAGLDRLGLLPKFGRGTQTGQKYKAINDILLNLADALETDLWTLDVLWWSVLDDGLDLDEPPVTKEAATERRGFSLEKQLQIFLLDNWARTQIGQEWDLLETPENPEAGSQYHCPAGRIDFLAKHKTDPRWLVIELKKGQTSDEAVGQALRYMGWVKSDLAQGEEVEGLIIALAGDKKLEYAASMVPQLSFMRYEVNFSLRSPYESCVQAAA